jgi:Fe-S-cluster-containing dehydrogenase component
MIIVNESLCSGCRSCEFACSFQQRGCFHYNNSLIKIKPNAKKQGFFKPTLCRHCLHPQCKEACPEQAITKDKNSGIVAIDRTKCTGCGLCVTVCPWKVPNVYAEEGYAALCDLCKGDPSCVKFCGPGALQVKG